MPLLKYDVTGEVKRPVDLPGGPDAQGEVNVMISSADMRAGRGRVIVEGWVKSSLSRTVVEIDRTEGQLAGGRITIAIDRKGKAAGVCTITILAGWEKAEMAGVVTLSKGPFAGQQIEATGQAGLIAVEVWEPGAAVDPGQPPPPAGDKGFRFATDFLTGWPGGKCDLFQLSKATTAAERAANLAHKRANGYTVVCPYFHNTGDGDGKHPVNALADRAHTNAVLAEMRAAGLAVVGFIFSDSHKVSKSDQPRVALETVQAFDAAVDAWCLYLEPKDTADAATVAKVGAAVRAATSKLVFIHTYPAASDPASIRQYTGQSWCDGVLVQISHPAKPIPMANVPKVAKALLAAAGGKYVIAMEYSWTAIERDMGDEWIRNGLHGAGDGLNAATVAKLPLLRRAGAVKPDQPDQSAGELTFTMTGNGEKDVRWSPHVDRSDKKRWPVKSVDGSDCNALLYGAREGEALRKIEWVKVGDDHAHTKNAWAFKNDRKYNQRWVGGEKVVLALRDINGREVVNGLTGRTVTR